MKSAQPRREHADWPKIIQAVEEMKASITQLKQDISDAKTRQTQAIKDIKQIERDMKDFSNNKDDKLAQLQVGWNSASVATLTALGFSRPPQEGARRELRFGQDVAEGIAVSPTRVRFVGDQFCSMLEANENRTS